MNYHLQERLRFRDIQNKQTIYFALNKLFKLIKNKTIRPKGKWYLTVKDKNNNIDGYIVGTGLSVCSILSNKMVPFGKEINI